MPSTIPKKAVAALRDGDAVTIDIPNHRLDVDLPDAKPRGAGPARVAGFAATPAW